MNFKTDRIWLIKDGVLGTADRNLQGEIENFVAAEIVPRTAVAYCVAMRSGYLQKCFDYEVTEIFVDLNNWFCQEHKCGIARSIRIRFAGQLTDDIQVPASDPIKAEVDGELKEQLQEAYLQRIFN